ncbi:hypothetical protein QFZ75_003345 [Streptomyces sp. V3I8]|jgi:hypothetical protein|uniref:hypothetical protein n=1 Tax=Streptomyces sp. V3I8 TaxID=3042279 RepID=UPI00278989D4|nr:hypothetical protein [Streptomyces sp. V3I8]MDQ1036929.1 hypothetical protein [Streptomyces sp. V3I8]
MTTTDPYRLDGGAENPYPAGTGADRDGTGRDGVTKDGIVRTALWLALVISTVGNMAASFGAASTEVHLVCGAVTALCATVLVVRHLRGRR